MAERMFVDETSLFMSQLEERIERTGVEVEGLMRLFSEHGVPPGVRSSTWPVA